MRSLGPVKMANQPVQQTNKSVAGPSRHPLCKAVELRARVCLRPLSFGIVSVTMQAAAAAPAGRLSGQGASQRRSGPVVPVVRRTYSSRNSTNRLSTVCQVRRGLHSRTCILPHLAPFEPSLPPVVSQLQLTRSSPAPAEPRREPEQQQGPPPAAPAPSDHSTLPQL